MNVNSAEINQSTAQKLFQIREWKGPIPSEADIQYFVPVKLIAETSLPVRVADSHQHNPQYEYEYEYVLTTTSSTVPLEKIENRREK